MSRLTAITFGHVLKFGQIRSMDFGVMGVYVSGYAYYPKFWAPPSGKTVCQSRGKHVLEVQESTDLLHHCGKFGVAQISRTPRGQKGFMFFCLFVFYLSVMLLNDKVCECHVAISALEYGNDLGIFGKGIVVYMHPHKTLSLQCWAEPRQNDKFEKR